MMWILIFSLLPALFYLLIIYWTTPYKSWNFKKAIYYFIFGSFSVGLLLTTQGYIPEIHKIGRNEMDALFLFAFIQVALMEEFIKYLFYMLYFKIYDKIRKPDSHPLSTMIYCGSVALGFAFIENITYGFRYGVDVLAWRSVTSVIAHMSFGFMMGYWISLYKHKLIVKTNPIGNYSGISIFDLVIKKFPKFKNVFYTIMGIFIATFFHGLYDYNLMGEFGNTDVAWTIMFMIIASMISIVYLMTKNLIKLHNNKIINFKHNEI